MSKYKIGDKFIVISSDMDSVKVGDILNFSKYSGDGFYASGWFILLDLSMDGYPKTKLYLLEENMCNFKVGDTVKLVSKKNNTALQIGDIGNIYEFNNDGRCRVNTDSHTKGNWCMLSDLELVKRENKIYKNNWVKLSDLELITKDIKMKKIYIEVEDGYEVDTINSTPTCIKFKKEEKKQVTCWEDLEEISGYYVDSSSNVIDFHTTDLYHGVMNLFATKEQAEACIALAMLSQLMKDVNGDWIPDWANSCQLKHTISFYDSKIDTGVYSSNQRFLAFQTREIRDIFLKNHEELIIKAKPLI